MSEPSGRTSPDRASDERLLAAILDFVLKHPDPNVQRFADAAADWGDTWRGVAPVHLRASDTLEEAAALADPATVKLLGAFVRARKLLRWEQCYTAADGVVGDDMLSGYGYAEVIGKQGPFVSTRMRAGVAAYGPHLNYPLHRHQAEEIYAILAGSAAFALGDDEPALRKPGDVLYHAPHVAHGLRTTGEPLVIAYLWQNGDLREKPGFVRAGGAQR